jgi:hypothetical protein
VADLKVNYAALDDAQLALSRIAAEFEHMEARRDSLAEIWGPDSIRDAMKGFADNWDRHRAGLLEDVHKVGAICAATVDTFRTCEHALADAVTVAVPAELAPGASP